MEIKFELTRGMKFVVSNHEHMENWHPDMNDLKGTVLTVDNIRYSDYDNNVRIKSEEYSPWVFTDEDKHIDWIRTMIFNGVKINLDNELFDKVFNVLIKNGVEEDVARKVFSERVEYNRIKKCVVIK